MEKNKYEEFIKRQIEKVGYNVYTNVIVRRPEKFRFHPQYRYFYKTEIDNLVIGRDAILICECKARKGISYYNSSWGSIQSDLFKKINGCDMKNFFQTEDYVSSEIYYNGENVTSDLIGQIKRQLDFLREQTCSKGKTVIPIIVTNSAIRVKEIFKRNCIVRGIWIMQTSFFIDRFLPSLKEINEFKQMKAKIDT
jgi:hypothetical protein